MEESSDDDDDDDVEVWKSEKYRLLLHYIGGSSILLKMAPDLASMIILALGACREPAECCQTGRRHFVYSATFD